jgi:hypothetical protein
MGKQPRRETDNQAKQPSAKAFLEMVEQYLAACSADDLRAAVRRLADETPSDKRLAFLRQMQPAKRKGAARPSRARAEALLEDIDGLRDDLEEASEHADAWEERGPAWGGYYDDEGGLGQYVRFVKPATALFRRAQAAFGRGDWALARQAYQKLFDDVLGFEDDYGRGLRVEDLNDVDSTESRARYLRAVYQSEAPGQRAPKVLAAMQQVRAWFSGTAPRLVEMIAASPAPLPDQARFLNEWTGLVRKQKGQAADVWLREAVQLAQGTKGLGELARAEGRRHPRAFLDWGAALAAEGKHAEALAAAQTALKRLPAKAPIRAAIADQLCAAALRLNDQAAFSAGRWEAFSAAPTLPRVLDVWECTRPEQRRAQMQRCARHIASYLKRPPRPPVSFEAGQDDLDEPVWIENSVLAHAYLLAGDLAAARALAARQKVLGWSDGANPQGLVLALSLIVLSGKPFAGLPPKLKQIWRSNLEATLDVADCPSVGRAEAKQRNTLEGIYAGQLAHWQLSQAEQADLLKECLSIIRRRVAAIVGEKHRRSYAKAAALAAAGAEVLRLREDAGKAQGLLNGLYERYPRHRAFLNELDKATGRPRRRG